MLEILGNEQWQTEASKSHSIQQDFPEKPRTIESVLETLTNEEHKTEALKSHSIQQDFPEKSSAIMSVLEI